MEAYERLKKIVEAAAEDVAKADGGNKAAGTRVRKAMQDVKAAAQVRRVLAVWNDIEDLVNVGAYTPGESIDFDVAVRLKGEIDAFLQQGMEERFALKETREALLRLAKNIRRTQETLKEKKQVRQPVATSAG